jgi:hypothetical protein
MRLLIGIYLLLGLGQIGLSFLFGALAIQDWLNATSGRPHSSLSLLGLSWWALAVCIFAASMALAMLAGWTDGSVLGTNDPPGVTLSMAFAIAVLPALQMWLLLRSPVRDAFRRRAEGTPPSHPTTATSRA